MSNPCPQHAAFETEIPGDQLCIRAINLHNLSLNTKNLHDIINALPGAPGGEVYARLAVALAGVA